MHKTKADECIENEHDFAALVGNCTEMCPLPELKLRKKEKLLHRYERGSYKPVKEFSRPAAGQKPPDSDTVRTPDTLIDCVRYLVKEVLVPKVWVKEEQLEVYHFVFDRLRAVRQDLVVQRVKNNTSMSILSTCVRFHLLFGHILAGNPNFSQHINISHQLECVKSCLLLSTSSNPTMESVYLLSNMDSPSALVWAVSHPHPSPQLQLSLSVSLAYQESNWVRYFHLISTMPVIFLLSSARYSHLMCHKALSVYSKGYKSRNARYPLEHLATLLWLSTSSLTKLLSERDIAVKDESVLWGTNQEKDAINHEVDDNVYHEQIEERLYKVKDQLEVMLLE